MSKVKGFLVGVAATVLAIGGLYAAGFRIEGPATKQADPSSQAAPGQGRNTPGWRKAQGAPQQMMAPPQGSGGQGMRTGTAPPGSRQGQGRGGAANAARNQDAAAQNMRPGAQPGFGPSGGILLPIRPGTDPVPVLLDGKEKGKFVGKDLVEHVEDTVIATSEGPRKGWGVEKTLAYLGIKNPKEVIVYDGAGKKLTMSSMQIKDAKTFILLTYDDKGSLLLASGPKVRGTNKGTTSMEQVKKMVEGRNDLVGVPNVVRIEVRG